MVNVIIYEQPLSDIFRACLRLEYLFAGIAEYLNSSSSLAARNLVATIIQIMNLLERPDLKAKLAKELVTISKQLLKCQDAQQMDKNKLSAVVAELKELSDCFINSTGKIGQNLRDMHLLNTLRLHIMTPGGGLNFDVPVYHYWLNQAAATRLELVKVWLAEFKHIKQAIILLLRVIRESARMHTKVAVNGFYQELFDGQQRLSLIRVAIPNNISAYPEISISRHFVSIRLFCPEITTKPPPYDGDVTLGLSYCYSASSK